MAAARCAKWQAGKGSWRRGPLPLPPTVLPFRSGLPLGKRSLPVVCCALHVCPQLYKWPTWLLNRNGQVGEGRFVVGRESSRVLSAYEMRPGTAPCSGQA